jgi:hypothetical protein
LICPVYHERVTTNAPHMPDENEIIHKIILSAIIMLGMTIGHQIASHIFGLN